MRSKDLQFLTLTRAIATIYDNDNFEIGNPYTFETLNPCTNNPTPYWGKKVGKRRIKQKSLRAKKRRKAANKRQRNARRINRK